MSSGFERMISRFRRTAFPVLLAALGLMALAAAAAGVARADELRDRAAAILKEKGCIGCHIVPGVPEAQGKMGPSLEGLMDKRRIAGGKLKNTPKNLRIWLRNPKDVKTTMMPNLHLSEEEITTLIEFFKTI